MDHMVGIRHQRFRSDQSRNPDTGSVAATVGAKARATKLRLDVSVNISIGVRVDITVTRLASVWTRFEAAMAGQESAISGT
jgi:hypothetical protein